MSQLVKTPYTTVEKAAGRLFRDTEQAKLTALMESDPPTFKMPSFISHQRHECPARNDVSTAIQLQEVYVHSPNYAVWPIKDNPEKASDYQAVELSTDLEPPVSFGELPVDHVIVPAGRFGFWYKEGKCRGKTCKATVRSPAGVFCDAYERPPIEGRVSR